MHLMFFEEVYPCEASKNEGKDRKFYAGRDGIRHFEI